MLGSSICISSTSATCDTNTTDTAAGPRASGARAFVSSSPEPAGAPAPSQASRYPPARRAPRKQASQRPTAAERRHRLEHSLMPATLAPTAEHTNQAPPPSAGTPSHTSQDPAERTASRTPPPAHLAPYRRAPPARHQGTPTPHPYSRPLIGLFFQPPRKIAIIARDITGKSPIARACARRSGRFFSELEKSL